jgi:hypothetical protein
MAYSARPASARASSAVTDVLGMYSDLRVRRGELAVRWLPANVPRMTSPICRDLNGRSLLEELGLRLEAWHGLFCCWA